MLVDPGTRIPPAATAVHGITDEQVEAMGVTPTEAVIALALALDDGDVVVAHNYSYDAAIVKNECKLAGPSERAALRLAFQSTALCEQGRSCARYRHRGLTAAPTTSTRSSSSCTASCSVLRPQGRLHDAAVDSAVTLRCYMMMAHNTSIDPATLGPRR